VSSGQVDQLFTHLSQQLVQVRSSVSDALQTRYDYYTSGPGHLSAEVVEDISRQLTMLTAIIDYTEKARHEYFHDKICDIVAKIKGGMARIRGSVRPLRSQPDHPRGMKDGTLNSSLLTY